MEMRDEELSSVGTQDLDTRGYQVCGLNDIEFYWERDQLDVDAVFGPGTNTSFCLTALDDLKMWEIAQNPILLEE